MTRNNRLVFITAMLLLHLMLFIRWGGDLGDVDPNWFSVPFLLLLGLVYFLRSWKLREFLLLQLGLFPGAYSFYHLYCGLPVAAALLLLARCFCLLALLAAFFYLIAPLEKPFLRTGLQLVVALGLPALAAAFLLEQNLFFLVLLPLSVSLYTYIRDWRAKYG